MEYWTPYEPFELPKNVPKLWSYKSETDLFDFKKVGASLSSDQDQLKQTSDENSSHMHHIIPRLFPICHLFSPGPSSPNLLILVGQNFQEI